MDHDKDDKIRQYVMKKQQQREHAQNIRNQRRNKNPQQQSNNNHQQQRQPQSRYNNNNGRSNSFQSNNRVIGDPFAPVTNNENMDTMNTMNSKPSWNSNTEPQPIKANKPSWNSNTDGSQYNDPYDNGNQYQNNNNHHRGGFNNDYNSRNQAPKYGQNTPFGKAQPRQQQQQNSFDNEPIADNNYDNYNNNNNANKWATPAPRREPSRDHIANNNYNPNPNANFRNRRGQSVNTNRHNNVVQSPPQQQQQQQQMHDPYVEPAPSHHSGNKSVKASVVAVDYATASDFKKVVSMVEQLRGQMHALQFQIDNVKEENNKLKQKIVDLEEEQKEIKSMKQQQTRVPVNNIRDRVGSSNPMNNARNKQFSKQSSMDIDNNNSSNQPPQQQQFASSNKYGFNRQNNNANMDRFNHANPEQNRPSNNDRFGNGNGDRFNAQNQKNTFQQDDGFGHSTNDRFNSQNQYQNNDNGNANENTMANLSAQNLEQFNKQQQAQSQYGNGNRHQTNDRFNGNNAPQNNQNNFNGDDDEENEVKAPPQSSAADLIAKLEQTQGAYEQPQQLIPCNQCGRKFSHKALQRHIKICKKVFGQKRKAFKNKAVDDEALKAKRNSNQAAIEAELKRKKEQAKIKWKAESSMLRNAIKSSKMIEKAMKEGKSIKDIPNMPDMSVPDTRVPCPHCGRKFAEETAKRHIPKCQNIKSRPKFLKRKR